MTNQQGDEYTAKPDRPLTLAEIKARADAMVAATPEPRWERTILWAALLLAALFAVWAPGSDRPSASLLTLLGWLVVALATWRLTLALRHALRARD